MSYANSKIPESAQSGVLRARGAGRAPRCRTLPQALRRL